MTHISPKTNFFGKYKCLVLKNAAMNHEEQPNLNMKTTLAPFLSLISPVVLMRSGSLHLAAIFCSGLSLSWVDTGMEKMGIHTD